MSKIAILIAVIGFLAAVTQANAAVHSAPIENECDSMYQELTHTPFVVKYARTGILPGQGSKPIHPRAWYLAALGMRSKLRSFLEAHPHEIGDPDLLLAAIYTSRKATVAMLLQMGFNPNTPGQKGMVLPLYAAAHCAQPIVMTYLLEAGANVYGTTSASGYLAIAVAIVGPWIDKPFVEGVRLLLAAGFDPRCPVTKVRVTGSGLAFCLWD